MNLLQALHLPHLQHAHLDKLYEALPSSNTSQLVPLATSHNLNSLSVWFPSYPVNLRGPSGFNLESSIAESTYETVTRLDLKHAPAKFTHMETFKRCSNVKELRIKLSGNLQPLPVEVSLMSPFTHLHRWVTPKALLKGLITSCLNFINVVSCHAWPW